jgi:methyltransferase (TIGR00027 family)
MKKLAPKRTESDFIQSASVTAMMRALLSEKNEFQNPDYLAKYFVPHPWSEFLKDREKSIENLEERVPGCIYYHLVRTKKFDQLCLKWLKENKNGQIIILGSGFDSRAIRFQDKLDKNFIYEFDLKQMLNYKKEIIKSNNFCNSLKSNFIDINFHEDSLIESFFSNKIDQHKNTLIIWEGVTYFLDESTIIEILNNLNEYFTNELEIILDYAYRDYINGNLSYYGASELNSELKEINEPHLFGLEQNKLDGFFNALGYKVDENSKAEDLENEFGLKKKIHAFHGILKIEKRVYNGKI